MACRVVSCSAGASDCSASAACRAAVVRVRPRISCRRGGRVVLLEPTQQQCRGKHEAPKRPRWDDGRLWDPWKLDTPVDCTSGNGDGGGSKGRPDTPGERKAGGSELQCRSGSVVVMELCYFIFLGLCTAACKQKQQKAAGVADAEEV